MTFGILGALVLVFIILIASGSFGNGASSDGVSLSKCGYSGGIPTAIISIHNTTGSVQNYTFTVDFLQNGEIFDQSQQNQSFIATGQPTTVEVQRMDDVSGPIQCKVVDVTRVKNYLVP